MLELAIRFFFTRVTHISHEDGNVILSSISRPPESDINLELKLGSLPLPRVAGKNPLLSTYVSRRKVPSSSACFMPFSVSCDVCVPGA